MKWETAESENPTAKPCRSTPGAGVSIFTRMRVATRESLRALSPVRPSVRRVGNYMGTYVVGVELENKVKMVIGDCQQIMERLREYRAEPCGRVP